MSKRWRLVEVAPAETRPDDLTSSEVVGISVLLTHQCGEPRDEHNIYWRAMQKIQPVVQIAIED